MESGASRRSGWTFAGTFGGAGARLVGVALAAALAGCGGGGGGAGAPAFPAPAPGGSGGTFGPEGPSASFAQQCAADNLLAEPQRRTATIAREKQWLRAYFDEAYLWPQDVSNVNPASSTGSTPYAAMDAYFNALTSRAVTASGSLRDRFSFTIPTAEWNALTRAGEAVGYGVEWAIAGSGTARRIRIAYVEPAGPAVAAGLRRGDELVSVDGVAANDGTSSGVDALNAALFPSTSGEAHAFVLTPREGGAARSVPLRAQTLSSDPVPLSKVLDLPNGTKAGYLVFHDHNLPAEAKLIAALRSFQSAGVRDLVVDLRYNGGGYLFLAAELGHMIAGSQRVAGRAFEQLRYSSKRSAENETTPFRTVSCLPDANFQCTDVSPLPSLNLARVYVLAGGRTCSASESLVNGLRGVDVEVLLIGDTTCGKPYGFTAKDNCGVSYLPIEFEGVNAKGFGDYSDGFEPSTVSSGRQVPGCRVADDFSRELGDPTEARLAAALQHASSGTCPPVTSASASDTLRKAQAGSEGAGLALRLHPARSNRIHVPGLGR